MLQISADILALSTEAALILKNGRIAFANSAACSILGDDCTGKTTRSVLGESVAGTQANAFICNLPIGGKHYIVRVNTLDGVRAVFLSSYERSTALINDALVYSLRNCLMSLGITTEMVRTRAEDADDRDLLRGLATITHDCYRINRMLSNVTVIRGINDGTLFCAMQQLDLSKLLNSLVNTVNLLIDSPHVSISVPDGLQIPADAAMIETLVLNLISNCLVHAAGCTRINLRVIDGRDCVILSVDDDGCGISAEDMSCVFDRYRHSFVMGELGRGGGLGLTAVLGIARLHNGTLMLESREGIGTTVRVSLSRSPGSTVELCSHPAEPDSGMHEILTGLADCLPDDRFSEKYLG